MVKYSRRYRIRVCKMPKLEHLHKPRDRQPLGPMSHRLQLGWRSSIDTKFARPQGTFLGGTNQGRAAGRHAILTTAVLNE